MDIESLIAELLPIAESLFSLIDKIKTQAPDAWSSVSQEYVQAAQAWNDAKLAAAQDAPPLAASAATVEAAPGTEQEPPNEPVPAPHTLTTAEQVAAGIPPANYSKPG